jgi:DNA-binding XRE family transcriptional regulator
MLDCMVNQCLTLVVMKPSPKTRSEGIRVRQGETLRRYREHTINPVTGKLGVTQMQVAQAIGVTKAAVSDWERGNTSPRPHHQVELARYFKAPWSVLFGLDGEAA